MAKLYFRYSAMNAGKTIDLLKVAYNYEERGRKVLILTSALDDRFGVGKVTSRLGIQREAIIVEKETDLIGIINNYINENGKVDCILVDEAQFLSMQNVKQLTEIVDDFDIPVICYGLRADFQGELFPGSYALFCWADSIEEIKTICHCGKKAIMNMRIHNGKKVSEGEQIFIGGKESYVSVCRKHYKEGKIK